jgi:hypothetical protein
LFLKKLNIGLPYNPVVLFLGVYLSQTEKRYSDKGMCTRVFPGTPFTIEKKVETAPVSI